MISSEKEPLAKGRSWILKTSLLERALIEAKIEIDVQLTYRTPQTGSSILEAFYWMPNSNVPNRRLYVRAGSLPSGDRAAAFAELTDTALPALVAWLGSLHCQPENAPVLYTEPYFDARFVDGHIQIVSKPAA